MSFGALALGTAMSNPAECEELERAMILEMRELLGTGYVFDYYQQAAAPFVQIARQFAKKKLGD
jgi:hypothetical protein